MDTDGLILILLGVIVLVVDGWLYLFSERLITRLDVSPVKFGHFLLLVLIIAFFLIILGLAAIFKGEKKE